MTEIPRIRKETGIFWVEVDRIRPNTRQPRRVFEEDKLKELSESIRQYGVLQPLVVVREEKETSYGVSVEYEIIAGERRWRASRMAGLSQVPVIIREEPTERVKLELALIENLQREDLSPLERADAFSQLVSEFKMKHHEVGMKMGKSREYVSNTLRLLSLPEEIREGLRQGLIKEGHTRPLLSLSKQKEDQISLYKEIIYRKMTVRETEKISRDLVRERKVRKMRAEKVDPEVRELEQQLTDALGTRVSVERRGPRKKISIEFFSEDELGEFLSKVGLATQEAEIEVPEDAIKESDVNADEEKEDWMMNFSI